MRRRSLRYDKDVKPLWKKGMNLFWVFILVVWVVRILASMWSKYNKGGEGFLDVLNWVMLISVVLFIIPGIIYLIKPDLFKQRSSYENNHVQ